MFPPSGDTQAEGVGVSRQERANVPKNPLGPSRVGQQLYSLCCALAVERSMSTNVVASLAFGQCPEALVCVHKRVRVEIVLKRRGNATNIGNEEFPVKLSVVNCGTNEIFENVDITECSSQDQSNMNAPVHRGSMTISLNQDKLKCELFLRFSQSTISSAHKDLKLIASHSDTSSSIVLSAESPPFVVVEKYLFIETNMPEPYVFFKDVGGKDQAIQLSVSLRRSVTPHEESDPIEKSTSSIVVRPVLRYGSGQLVQDQTILKSINDANKFRISSDGTTTLRFRISEVSSKHRNERFVICMEQFVNPTSMAMSSDDSNSVSSSTMDVASGKSVPIDVRSKLNHNSVKRREAAAAAAAADIVSLSATKDTLHHVHKTNDNHGILTMEEPASKRIRLEPHSNIERDYNQFQQISNAPALLLQAAATVSAAAFSSVNGSSNNNIVEHLKELQSFLSDFTHEVEKLTILHNFISYEGVSKQWFEDAKKRAEVVSLKLKHFPEQIVTLKSLQMTMEAVALLQGQSVAAASSIASSSTQPINSNVNSNSRSSTSTNINNNNINNNNTVAQTNLLQVNPYFRNNHVRDASDSSFNTNAGNTVPSLYSHSSSSSLLPFPPVSSQVLSQQQPPFTSPSQSASLSGDPTSLSNNNNNNNNNNSNNSNNPKSTLHQSLLSHLCSQSQPTLSFASQNSMTSNINSNLTNSSYGGIGSGRIPRSFTNNSLPLGNNPNVLDILSGHE